MKKTIKQIIFSILRITGFIAVGFVALLLAVVIVLQTSWSNNHLLGLLVREASKNIAGEITAGRLSGNLFTGLALDDIRVASAGGEILAIERLEARYRLLPLLNKRVRVRSLVLTEPRVTLRREAEGAWNIAALFRAPAQIKPARTVSDAPWRLSVRSFKIVRGSVSAGFEGARENMDFADVEMDVGGNIRTGKKLRARLDLRQLSAKLPEKNVALRHLGASARWEGDLGTLQSFEFRTDRSSVTARGVFERGDVARVKASIVFKVDAEELASVTGRRLSGGAIEGHVNVDGDIRALAFEQQTAWLGMSVGSKGTVDAVTPSIAMHVTAKNIHPARLAGSMGGTNADVINADADITARGKKLSEMVASVNVSAFNSRLRNAPVNNAAIQGDLRRGVLISSFSVDMAAGSVTATASGTVSGFIEQDKAVDLAVRGTVARADISKLSAGAPVSDLNAFISGRLVKYPGRGEAFSAETSVSIDSSSIKGIAIYPSFMAGTYHAPSFTVREANIDSELGQLRIDGSAAAAGNISARFDLRAERLERWETLLPGVPLSGSAVLTGTVSGSVRHPEAAVKLDAYGIGISGAEIENLSLQAMMNDMRNAQSGPASLTIRAEGITRGGKKIREAAFSAQRSTATTEIDLKAALDDLRGAAITGSVTTDGTVLKKIHLARFEVHDGTMAWQNRGPAEARSTAAGWELTPFVVSSPGGGQISVSGSSRGDALDYTVRSDSVTVSEAGALAGLNIPFEGILRGAATLSGSFSSPIVAGQLLLENENALVYPFSRVSASFSYSDESAQAVMALEKDGETLLTAEGDMPVTLTFAPFRVELLSAGMDVQLTTARLSPSLFTSFIRGIDKADGALRADLSIRGDPRDPSVSGRITVDSGTLALAATDVEYSKIFARIFIADDVLTLDRLSLRGGDGTAEVTGKAVLAGGGLERFDLGFAFRRFKLMETRVMAGTIDGDLRWQGSLYDHDVTGSASLLNGYYRIPETSRTRVQEVVVIESSDGSAAIANKPENGGLNLYDGMNMDARLTVPGNFWLRGRGINAELQGNLVFRKSIDSDIRIAGTVRTVRGSYVFRQRTLNITEGTVVFSGSSPIDAFLNIRAAGRINDVTVIVVVGGTLSDPEISLQSTPVMDQSDILSYLVFGRPANKLTQSEGSVLQNTTASVVSDIAIKGLRDVLGSDLTPDVLMINPEGRGGYGVGKYLNDRLFVKYEWNIGLENLSQTTVEYEINRFFNLRSQAGSEKNTGLDLLWRYEY